VKSARHLFARSEGVVDLFQLLTDNGRKPDYKQAAAVDTLRDAVEVLRAAVTQASDQVTEQMPRQLEGLATAIGEVNSALQDTLARIHSGPLADPASDPGRMVQLVQEIGDRLEVSRWGMEARGGATQRLTCTC